MSQMSTTIILKTGFIIRIHYDICPLSKVEKEDQSFVRLTYLNSLLTDMQDVLLHMYTTRSTGIQRKCDVSAYFWNVRMEREGWRINNMKKSSNDTKNKVKLVRSKA